MVPFGSLSTDVGHRGTCTDPSVSGGGKPPGAQGGLGYLSLLLGQQGDSLMGV